LEGRPCPPRTLGLKTDPENPKLSGNRVACPRRKPGGARSPAISPSFSSRIFWGSFDSICIVPELLKESGLVEANIYNILDTLFNYLCVCKEISESVKAQQVL